MNGDEHPQPDAGGESSENQQSTTSGTDPATQEFEDLKDAVKKAWGDGAEKARAAAEESIPKAKSMVEKAAYEFIYEIAYGTTFASTLAREVVPEILRKATTSGSTAGRQAAEDFQKQRQAGFEADTSAPGPEAGAEPA